MEPKLKAAKHKKGVGTLKRQQRNVVQSFIDFLGYSK